MSAHRARRISKLAIGGLALVLSSVASGLAMFAGIATITDPQLGDDVFVGAQTDVEGTWANPLPLTSVNAELGWLYLDPTFVLHDLQEWSATATMDNATSGDFEGFIVPLRTYTPPQGGIYYVSATVRGVMNGNPVAVGEDLNFVDLIGP